MSLRRRLPLAPRLERALAPLDVEGAAHAAPWTGPLDDWLRDGAKACALLEAPEPGRREALLSWVNRVAREPGVEVTWLALPPGLRTERDVLAVLLAALGDEAMPLSPEAMRREIRAILEEPPRGSSARLLVVDGAAGLADAFWRAGPPLWPVAPGTKVLLSDSRSIANGSAGFPPDETLHIEQQGVRESEPTSDEGRPETALLDAALAPLPRAWTERIAAQAAEARAAPHEHDLRAAHARLARALMALPEGADPADTEALTGYSTLFLGEHLERAGAPLEAFSTLLSRSRVQGFCALGEGQLGVTTDLERVRRRALAALAEAPGSGTEALSTAVRAALLQATAESMVRWDDEAAEPRVGGFGLDLETPLHDEGAAVRALLACLEAERAADRPVIAAWILARLGALEPEARAEALVSLLALGAADEPQRALREAESAYREAQGSPCWGLLSLAPHAPAEVGRAWVREVLSAAEASDDTLVMFAFLAAGLPRDLVLESAAQVASLPAERRQPAWSLLAGAAGREAAAAAFADLAQRIVSGEDTPDLAKGLFALLDHLERDDLLRAVDVARRLTSGADEVRVKLAERLSEVGDEPRALALAGSLEGCSRAEALCAVARRSPEPEPIVARLLAMADEVSGPDRFGVLALAAPLLASAGRARDAAARAAPLPPPARYEVLCRLAAHAPAGEARSFAEEALEIARGALSREPERLLGLVSVASLSRAEVIGVLGELLAALAARYRSEALHGGRPSVVDLLPWARRLLGGPGVRAVAEGVESAMRGFVD